MIKNRALIHTHTHEISVYYCLLEPQQRHLHEIEGWFCRVICRKVDTVHASCIGDVSLEMMQKMQKRQKEIAGGLSQYYPTDFLSAFKSHTILQTLYTPTKNKNKKSYNYTLNVIHIMLGFFSRHNHVFCVNTKHKTLTSGLSKSA